MFIETAQLNISLAPSGAAREIAGRNTYRTYGAWWFIGLSYAINISLLTEFRTHISSIFPLSWYEWGTTCRALHHKPCVTCRLATAQFCGIPLCFPVFLYAILRSLRSAV